MRGGEGRGEEGTGGALCCTALCVLHATALSVLCCVALCAPCRSALCALCCTAWHRTAHPVALHGTGVAAPHCACRAARHCVCGAALHV